MISEDGKNFTHHKNVDGDYQFFKMGRDVNIFHDEGTWYAYYCTRVMEARTAPSLEGPWSDPAVDIGHQGNPESPFVVRRDDDYYLWEQTFVYHSRDPLDFSRPMITKMTLPDRHHHARYAPEILQYQEQYYIAGYGRGLWMAKMGWELQDWDEIEAFRDEWKTVRIPDHQLRTQDND